MRSAAKHNAIDLPRAPAAQENAAQRNRRQRNAAERNTFDPSRAPARSLARLPACPLARLARPPAPAAKENAAQHNIRERSAAEHNAINLLQFAPGARITPMFPRMLARMAAQVREHCAPATNGQQEPHKFSRIAQYCQWRFAPEMRIALTFTRIANEDHANHPESPRIALGDSPRKRESPLRSRGSQLSVDLV